MKGSVEIIGGADGPTSVFVASKKKNLFSKIKGLIHKRRKAKAEALFSANPHTLEEVIHISKMFIRLRKFLKPTDVILDSVKT